MTPHELENRDIWYECLPVAKLQLSKSICNQFQNQKCHAIGFLKNILELEMTSCYHNFYHWSKCQINFNMMICKIQA